MAKTKVNILLFVLCLTLLGFILRFYNLGKIPNGLSPDEADVGYNAYSILETGKDVYGRSYPLFFQSLNDYKPGLPIYLTVIGVKLFGLSDFSVRIVPAFFGALTPLLFFFLGKLLYPEKKKFPFILLTLSVFAPWSIEISRAMIYYSEYVFLYLLVLITFFLGITKNNKILYVSSALLGITPYVYFSSFVYMPFIFIIGFLIYKDFFLKNLRTCIICAIIVFTFSLPAISQYFNPQIRSRFTAISLFTPDVTLPLSINEHTQDIQGKLPFSGLIHNRRFIYVNSFLDNYFDYFNLDYLFVNAKNIRYFYTNYIGLFYLFETPFFLFGLFKMISRRKKSDLLVLLLIVIGPIPAAITLGSPFPHRGLLLLVGVQIACALGVNAVVDGILKRKLIRYKVMTTLIVLVYFLNVYMFAHQYFVHSPKEFLSENDNGAWFSTVKSAMPKMMELKPSYQKIVFTWSKAKLVPPVYYLFYNKIDPTIIQNKALLWTNERPSYRQIYFQIENIEFRSIDWQTDQNLKNTLFIGYPSEFPKDIENVVYKTYLPTGEVQFLFVSNQ